MHAPHVHLSPLDWQDLTLNPPTCVVGEGDDRSQLLGQMLDDGEILVVLEEPHSDVVLSKHRKMRPGRDQAVLLRQREHPP